MTSETMAASAPTGEMTAVPSSDVIALSEIDRARLYMLAQARHILDSLEFRYTPKHGSWLNQAEIEVSALRAPLPLAPYW